MRPSDRELVPPSADWFGFACHIRRAPAPKRRADSDSCSLDGPLLRLLGCALAIDSLFFVVSLGPLARVDAGLFVSLLVCGPVMGLIDIQLIETTKWFPNKKDN